MAKGLTERAMLVSLTISQWLARIEDKAVTEKILSDYSANRKAGSFRKALLLQKGPLARIRATVNAIKKYHTLMTLPWTRGVGILPSAKWMEYSKRMRELITDFKDAVREFIPAFPSEVKNAVHDLGNLWKEKDYPDVSDLKSLFDIRLEAMPIPKAGDWRINLADEEIEELDREIEEREKEKTAEAMKRLWTRLFEPIKHMVEILSRDDPRIYKTLITNISDLTAILSDLNLTDDPKLEALRTEIEEKLCEHSANALKESKFLRHETAKAALEIKKKIADETGIESEDDILEMMSGYTGEGCAPQGKMFKKGEKK